MPPPPLSAPASSLLDRSRGPTRLPAIARHARQAAASATLPVLRASRSPMQLSLPFFAPTGFKGG